MPYSRDVKEYFKKEYSTVTGKVDNVWITRNSRSVTSNCTLEVNGVEVNFERMDPSSIDFFKGIKKGQTVRVQYLPHTKYGMRIEKLIEK